MKKILSTLPLDTDLAALLLRLIFGGLFVYHGYIKFDGYEQFQAMFPDLIGIGGPLSFNLVLFAELGCGFLVLIGLYTRFAVIPILITMVVAFFIAHGAQSFDDKELPFALMMLSLVVFVLGSGKYSADKMIP